MRMFATLMIFLSSSALADGTGRTILVSATVMRLAKMTVWHQLPTLHIVEADVKRGYIDVDGATQFSMHANCPYHVEVEVLSDFVLAANVKGLPPPGRGKTVAVLDYHLRLSPSTQPGTYPWPVRVFVHPE